MRSIDRDTIPEGSDVTTVGVDLGGTNVHAVVLGDDDAVLGRAKLRAPVTEDRTAIVDVVDAAIHCALDEAGGAELAAVGLGSPGVVMHGTVGGATNLPGFLERFSLGELVGEKLGRPVRVTNDVTAAALGEHRLGAGRGTDDLLAVHVGNGVGGGIVLGGRSFEGAAGGAGELGHVIVQRGGRVCPCGRRGCVEAFMGRRAMTLAAERAVAAGRPSVLFDVLREQGGGRVTSPMFREALDRGDELVADLVDAGVDALATGIAAAVNLLDVDVVVLGGDLAEALGEPFRLRVDAAVKPLLFLQPPRIHVVRAELGDASGAIGAALVAREVA